MNNWIKAALLEVQEYMRMVGRAARSLVTRPFYYRDIIDQLNIIGIGSLPSSFSPGCSPVWCSRCSRA